MEDARNYYSVTAMRICVHPTIKVGHYNYPEYTLAYPSGIHMM